MQLDALLCRAAALERGLLARLGPLLLAFVELRGPRALGFRSLDAYARDRLGMSARKARALLRLERTCQRAPALGEAWHAGALTVSQAQALVPILLAEGSELFHAAWIARASEVTVRRIEDDVEHALAAGTFDPARLPALPNPMGSLEDLPEGVQIGARPMRGDRHLGCERAHRSRPSLRRLPRHGGAAPRHRPGRGPRSDVRPRDRELVGVVAAQVPRVRARWMALHGAGLHVAAEPARAPRAVPLGGGAATTSRT